MFSMLLLLSVFWLVPFLQILRVSLQDEMGRLSLIHYRNILCASPIYLHMLWNSVKLTLPVLIGNIVVSLLGAFGFTVLSFKGKRGLFFSYVVVMLLPLQVTLMPNYMIMSILHLENSIAAIWVPGIFQPFGVVLCYLQMRLVSGEYLEAARIDGAGWKELFFFIYLPMVKSAVSVVLMLNVIDYWNLIDQAVIFIREASDYPLSVFLARVNESSRGVSAAAAVYYSLPILATLLYGQKALKQGFGIFGGAER